MPWEFQQELVPATPQDLAAILHENQHSAKLPVLPIGGGTSLNSMPGQVLHGIGLHTRELTQVVDYPARDLTITVETGMRIDQLNEILKVESQCLPIDIAQSNQATLGGVIASNTCGPRRFHHGTARDYVIGLTVVDATGQFFKSGGRVVKNVAGYDMHKLMIGSAGTLGVITQATIRLKPSPESQPLLWSSFHSLADIDIVLERLLTSATRPVALEVLTPQAAQNMARHSQIDCQPSQPVLIIGFEGTQIETDWELAAIREELAPFGPDSMSVIEAETAECLWKALTDFPVSHKEMLTFEASVLPSRTVEFLEQLFKADIAAQAHAGNGMVIGHIPASVSSENAMELLSEWKMFTLKSGGYLRILCCPEQNAAVLKDIREEHPSWRLMHEIKTALDPDGLLNPDEQYAFALMNS